MLELSGFMSDVHTVQVSVDDDGDLCIENADSAIYIHESDISKLCDWLVENVPTS